MRSLPTVLAAGALVIVLLLYMCSFQVRSTEVAVVKTFANADPNKVITEGSVASANYGEVDALVEITFYVAHEADISEVRNLVWIYLESLQGGESSQIQGRLTGPTVFEGQIKDRFIDVPNIT